MSNISSSDAEKLMEQSNEDLSKAMDQLSVTADNSDKTPPSLSDMPVDVVVPIIEKLDYRQHLKLRKVSKSLRTLVDKQKPACKSIKVECYAKNVYIKFNGHTVVYSKNVNNIRFNENAETRINIVRDDFKKVAFDDLTSTLKNPRLQLDELSVSFQYSTNADIEEYCNEMRNVLESLNHQMSVRKFASDLPFPSCLFFIIPYLKPGMLEIISLDLREFLFEFNWSIKSTEMDQVALLDQWKQAGELHLFYAFDWFPMEYATHFKRFRIREYVINTNKFDRIKKFLSKLEDFEYCCITHFVENDIDDVQRMTGIPVPPNMSHYSIPDSDYCLEFSIAEFDITIVKKICRLH